MNGSIMLRRLAALSRSRITQTAPARYFDEGYRRIRRCGRTNGRTFDFPRESVGGRIIEVSGQRGGKFSSRARHFLPIYSDGYHITVSVCSQKTSVLTQ